MSTEVIQNRLNELLMGADIPSLKLLLLGLLFALLASLVLLFIFMSAVVDGLDGSNILGFFIASIFGILSYSCFKSTYIGSQKSINTLIDSVEVKQYNSVELQIDDMTLDYIKSEYPIFIEKQYRESLFLDSESQTLSCYLNDDMTFSESTTPKMLVDIYEISYDEEVFEKLCDKLESIDKWTLSENLKQTLHSENHIIHYVREINYSTSPDAYKPTYYETYTPTAPLDVDIDLTKVSIPTNKGSLKLDEEIPIDKEISTEPKINLVYSNPTLAPDDTKDSLLHKRVGRYIYKCTSAKLYAPQRNFAESNVDVEVDVDIKVKQNKII